jgi:hypothetical protein
VKCLSRPRRTASNLSDSIHQQLNMYAVMASAAGVGMLALSQPAEAKIVYSPAHKLIKSGQTVSLDLNHDGKADFSFENYSNTFEGSEQGFLYVIPAQTQNGVDGEAIYDRALALKAGTPVGPKARFLTGHYISMVSADAAERCFGNWSNVKNRYLGLRFVIKQKTHFGWARLSVSCNSANNKIQALLTGYAYETIPNKPIITGKTKGPDDVSDAGRADPAVLNLSAPEPPTLGLLALGAPALSVWRREQSAAAML